MSYLRTARLLLTMRNRQNHRDHCFKTPLHCGFMAPSLQNMPIKVPDGFLQIMKVNMPAQGDIKKDMYLMSAL